MPSPESGQGPHFRVQRIITFCLLMLGTLLTAALSSQPALAYEQEVKQLSAQMAEVITKSGKKTVAVVDFTDLQGNVTELGRFLAEEFSVALSGNAKEFEVIDRTNLKTLLQENKLASTGIIDPQTARKLGEIAGVQALVTGNITPFGDSVRLSIKILDSATARVISGFSADIPRTKAIEELLAKGISSSVNPHTPAEEVGQTISAPTEDGKSAQNLHSGDFGVQLESCNMSGTTVSCRLLITYSGAGKRSMTPGTLQGGGGNGFFRLMVRYGPLPSRMFDNAGNEYHAFTARLGAQEGNDWVDNILVEGIPMSAWLVFVNVAPGASKITALVVAFSDSRENHTVKFGTVRLTK